MTERDDDFEVDVVEVVETNKNKRNDIVPANRSFNDRSSRYEDNDAGLIRQENIRNEEVLGDTRMEVIGLLKSRADFGKAVKEQLLFFSEQQMGIMNVIKNYGKSRVPYMYIGILIVIIAIIAMFSFQPEYAQMLSNGLSTLQGQVTLAVVLLIALIMVWFTFRSIRKKRVGN